MNRALAQFPVSALPESPFPNISNCLPQQGVALAQDLASSSDAKPVPPAINSKPDSPRPLLQ
jgi:hypothetical protein